LIFVESSVYFVYLTLFPKSKIIAEDSSRFEETIKEKNKQTKQGITHFPKYKEKKKKRKKLNVQYIKTDRGIKRKETSIPYN